MTDMKTSEAGVRFIASFEGYHTALPDGRCAAYWDKTGKVWTIGYGCTEGVKKGDVWTHAQAISRFRAELTRHEKFVTQICKTDLNQNQFDALSSFSYNCGPDNLKKLWAHYKRGGHDDVAKSFRLYNKSGGVLLNGLVRRRKDEGLMYARPVGAPKTASEAIRQSPSLRLQINAVISAALATVMGGWHSITDGAAWVAGFLPVASTEVSDTVLSAQQIADHAGFSLSSKVMAAITVSCLILLVRRQLYQKRSDV